MPICYKCKEFTDMEQRDSITGDLLCPNCGQELMKNGKFFIPPSEEDSSTEEVTSPEVFHSKKVKIISLISVCLLAGVIILGELYPFSPVTEEPFLSPAPLEEEHPPFLEDINQEEPPSEQPIHFLLPEGVFLGEELATLLTLYPHWKAMNQWNTHYADFQNHLLLPFDQSIEIDIIFFYFDTQEKLAVVEYILEPMDDKSLVEGQLRLFLEQDYRLLEETETYLLWEGMDGYLGLHRREWFLHLTQEREDTLSVLQ